MTMNKIQLISTLMVALALLPGTLQASTVEETMYSEGKIYVVVAVLSIIFAGLAIYLIMLDRKISKLEKNRKP